MSAFEDDVNRDMLWGDDEAAARDGQFEDAVNRDRRRWGDARDLWSAPIGRNTTPKALSASVFTPKQTREPMSPKRQVRRKKAIGARLVTDPKGRIFKVCYRENVNLGNYRHAHIEAERLVGTTESPLEALDEVKGFVRHALTQVKQEKIARGFPADEHGSENW